MQNIPTIEDLGRIAATAAEDNYDSQTEEWKITYNRMGVAIRDEAIKLCHHIASQQIDVSRFGSVSGGVAQKVIAGSIASLAKEIEIEVQA